MKDIHKWLNLTSKNLPNYYRYLQAGLTLCVGIGLSFAAYLAVYNWEQKFRQSEVQDRLDKIATNIQRDMDNNIEFVRGVAALYTISKRLKQNSLEKFIKTSIYRHSSIQTMALLPLEIDHNENHFPAKYVFTLLENKQILNFDFASYPSYQLALKKAIFEKDIVATNGTYLVGQDDRALSFLVFVPVYKQNLSYLDREALRGFVMSAFRIEPIIKSAIQEVKLDDDINLYLQDATAPENQRFLGFYEASTKQVITDPNSQDKLKMGQKIDCPDGTACTRIIKIENRRWILQLLLAAGYNTPAQNWRSWITIGFGLFLTTIVTLYLQRLLHYTQQIENLVGERTAQSEQLAEALRKIQQTQAHLVQTEKMSALGQLVAGVAHEINNPVNFIYGNLHYANQYALDLLNLVTFYQERYSDTDENIREYQDKIDVDFITKDFPRLIQSMKIGADRIREIVLSLKNFSRLDESEMKEVNIHEGIDNTLLILQTRLKARGNFPGIDVVKKYKMLPLIECYPSQLNQVFMNIISNSIDALESYYNPQTQHQKQPPTINIIIITEFSKPNYITVRIADNGPGITEEVKKKLFEPFFTTKPVGKGTGLGLSISYQIVVDKHKGLLWCESTPGQGTEFWIEIPVRQEMKSLTFEI